MGLRSRRPELAGLSRRRPRRRSASAKNASLFDSYGSVSPFATQPSQLAGRLRVNVCGDLKRTSARETRLERQEKKFDGPTPAAQSVGDIKPRFSEVPGRDSGCLWPF